MKKIPMWKVVDTIKGVAAVVGMLVGAVVVYCLAMLFVCMPYIVIGTAIYWIVTAI